MGIGRLTSAAERTATANAVDNFVKRAEKLGRAPGTHTLGKEFETPKK